MNYFVLFVKKTLRYILKPLSFIPAIVMMVLIFKFSEQSGTDSGSLSIKVSRIITQTYDWLFMKRWDAHTMNTVINQIHPYVRKGAHITEYFLLAMTVSLPMYVYKLRGIMLTIIAFIFCVSFACLDEYHQSFVAGRVGSGRDVLIDSIGIIVGIIVIQIICFIGRKTIFSWLVLDKG